MCMTAGMQYLLIYYKMKNRIHIMLHKMYTVYVSFIKTLYGE